MNAPSHQRLASDPAASVFVTANAGSGKTSTLVDRVARLLLRGAAPEAILCVTYTKAAAVEMQRRLFDKLGAWAVMADRPLADELAGLDERPEDLPRARALFARALETPGGLKIQTIHAFCEKLLRRFPLESGVSPGFRVLEDSAARAVSAQARDELAAMAFADGDGPVGAAYQRFSVELDWRSFNAMFATFEAKRVGIAAYVAACDEQDGFVADVWRRCGFDQVVPVVRIEAEAIAGVDWREWRAAAGALARSGAVTDQTLGARMAAVAEGAPFADVWGLFCTQAGQPLSRLGTKQLDPATAEWLRREQARLGEACERAKAARVAEDTVHALVLATAYRGFYEGAKAAGLDFGDLIEAARDLLTVRADAAWVLYKLDGGLDHVLLDEAQDTAPDQWDILHALTDEFFAGAGADPDDGRTVFAVGDAKQSIYSFQGAEPERFINEAGAFRSLVDGVGGEFRRVDLAESWRSTPEVLTFVDGVFADPVARAGLNPGDPGAVVAHLPRREAGFGAVELWPLEEGEPFEERDPWLPVDFDPPESANKKLARRIAQTIRRAVDDGWAVFEKAARTLRPVGYGDFLILVRRRRALFHEIIRALKREGVAVGGADRLLLSDHVVFKDLIALGRFALFPDDELTLAALLRSPLCDVDEDSLFDLAWGRQRHGLWGELSRRQGERPDWREAFAILDWARAEARPRTPFDFYARLLSRLDASGRSMRTRLLTRLGREAEDALEAFLDQALVAEQRGVRDLELFLAEMAESDVEVKREQEDGSGRHGGEVRVMTAHGAKGLEAPIVILPDTTTRAASQGGPLLDDEGGGFLWAPRKADDCPASAAARAIRDAAGAEESARLLYVALTRARDRLIVCGVKTRDHLYRDSWCDLVARAFDQPTIAPGARIVADAGAQITRFGVDPICVEAGPASSIQAAPFPAWVGRFAPAETLAQRYAQPSTVVESERGPAPSPLAEQAGLGRWRRGLLIHRLLQVLPDIAPAEREAAAATLLDRESDLTDSQRAEMAAAALAVLADGRFAPVFGPNSRPEAAIAGGAATLPPDLLVSGRVDRLVVEPHRVLVVDFKTNRPAPEHIEDADRAYLVQMAVYAAVLAEVFPGRRIEAALVWTDGPKLMAVPENVIAETLARLRSGVERGPASA